MGHKQSQFSFRQRCRNSIKQEFQLMLKFGRKAINKGISFENSLFRYLRSWFYGLSKRFSRSITKKLTSGSYQSFVISGIAKGFSHNLHFLGSLSMFVSLLVKSTSIYAVWTKHLLRYFRCRPDHPHLRSALLIAPLEPLFYVAELMELFKPHYTENLMN